MIGRVMWDAGFCGEENTGKLGAEFFSRVGFIPKTTALGESVSIQPAGMATPMRQLVQSRSIVIGRGDKRRFRGKVNAVSLAIVESPIVLVMTDLRARIHENPLCGFNNFKWLAALR